MQAVTLKKFKIRILFRWTIIKLIRSRVTKWYLLIPRRKMAPSVQTNSKWTVSWRKKEIWIRSTWNTSAEKKWKTKWKSRWLKRDSFAFKHIKWSKKESRLNWWKGYMLGSMKMKIVSLKFKSQILTKLSLKNKFNLNIKSK